MLAAALLCGAAVAWMTCSESSIPPGQNPITIGLCSFPRACYQVQKDGPLAGQCDDAACSSGGSCRLSYNAAAAPGAQWTRATGQLPAPGDTPAVCGAASEQGLYSVCASLEMLCVGRGPACPLPGSCVRGNTAGATPAAKCSAGVPVTPQHRPTGGGLMTYCPLVDDICCGAPALSDGGMTDGGSDGGMTDGGSDGGRDGGRDM
jgi:hypothetical protein